MGCSQRDPHQIVVVSVWVNNVWQSGELYTWPWGSIIGALWSTCEQPAAKFKATE